MAGRARSCGRASRFLARSRALAATRSFSSIDQPQLIKKISKPRQCDQFLDAPLRCAMAIHGFYRITTMFVIAVVLPSRSTCPSTMQLTSRTTLQGSLLARRPLPRFGTTTAPRPCFSVAPFLGVMVLSIHRITRNKIFGLLFASSISNQKIIKATGAEHPQSGHQFKHFSKEMPSN